LKKGPVGGQKSPYYRKIRERIRKKILSPLNAGQGKFHSQRGVKKKGKTLSARGVSPLAVEKGGGEEKIRGGKRGKGTRRGGSVRTKRSRKFGWAQSGMEDSVPLIWEERGEKDQWGGGGCMA